MNFLNSTGGLIYHIRAKRYTSLWSAHRSAVQSFLENWLIDSDEILLIGPSGGYSLPLSWLRSFKRIIAIEPDPLARMIFQSRTGLRPEYLKLKLDLENPDPVIQSFDRAVPILFCNILGQLPVKNEYLAIKNLNTLLEGRSYASYHDVLSGKGIQVRVPTQSNSKKKSVNELRAWIKPEDSLVTREKIELNQHQAYDWFQQAVTNTFEQKFTYWEWAITPSQTQLIEGVSYLQEGIKK